MMMYKSALVVVDIVIPVHNVETKLVKSIKTMRDYLLLNLPYSWRITIVDKASQDQTWALAQRLEKSFPGQVKALHLNREGHGRVLRYAWACSEAQIVSYMDIAAIDNNLNAFLPLIAPLISGHSMVASGSRLTRTAKDNGHRFQGFLFRCYALLMRVLFGRVFSDINCPFKAVRKEMVLPMLAQIEDNEGFFDSEFLAVARHNRLRISEVPLNWLGDLNKTPESKKRSLKTLKGLARLRLKFWLDGGLLQEVPECIPVKFQGETKILLFQAQREQSQTQAQPQAA